ncbi:MAG: hypothetical protein ACPGLY_28025 [Rubripirellula sp.]
MPKGLKTTSSPIQVSTSIQQTADPLTTQFLSKRVDLQLNPLDNEVFVVTGVKIDFTNPCARVDAATSPGDANLVQRCSISTTEQTTYAGIDSPSVIAASQIDALENGTIGYYVVMETNSMDAPPASMDYLQIIATNDFFVNLDTSTLFTAGEILRANVRVYGYRATADSSTYAALVQSELLSS